MAVMMRKCVLFLAILTSLHGFVLTESDCPGPPMSLRSDNPRRTCFKLDASNNLLVYSCDSLIKSLAKPLIKYCPVEICLENGTWTEPSLSCAMAECYNDGHSDQYTGHRICTKSGRPCQRWDKQEPHRHRFKTSDLFPDSTVSMAESFCRDPDGSKGAPWCNTMDPDKKWEFCDVKICSDLEVRDYFCGLTSFDSDDEENDGRTIRPIHATTMRTTTVKQAIPDVAHPHASCRDGVVFKTKNKVTVKGKPFRKGTARSNLECSVLCAGNGECKTFTYNKGSKMCDFYDGFDHDTRREKGTKMGTKSC